MSDQHQTPEAATHGQEPESLADHTIRAFDKRNKELERELQAVTEIHTAQFHVIEDQQQQLSTLRTALATAEARADNFAELVNNQCGDIEALTEVNNDLTRQLTEAQAACAAKDEAIKSAVRVFRDYAALHYAKQTPEAAVKAEVNAQHADKLEAALSNPDSDILKRLADAEKEREYFKQQCDEYFSKQQSLTAELSRLQAEVKETRDSARRELLEYCNRGGASWIATRQDILEAISAIDAARTQPKV